MTTVSRLWKSFKKKGLRIQALNYVFVLIISMESVPLNSTGYREKHSAPLLRTTDICQDILIPSFTRHSCLGDKKDLHLGHPSA